MSENQKHNSSQHNIHTPLIDRTADDVSTSEYAISQRRHQQRQIAADSISPYGATSRFNSPLPTSSEYGADAAAQLISPAGAAAEIIGHAHLDTQTTSSPARRFNRASSSSQLPLEVSTNGEELPGPPNGPPSSPLHSPHQTQESVSLNPEQLSTLLRHCSVRSGGTTSSTDSSSSPGTVDTTFEVDAGANEYRDLDTDKWDEWYREGPKK